jgi:predicted aconitase with swiveling domain
MITIRGRTVVPGVAAGEALVSHEPISGWGGIDPARGVIIEPRHELFGQCFAGKILVFPGAKGSSGWSGFFQSTRLLGTAPIGMIFTRLSTKAALGAVVTRVPAVTGLDQDPCEVIRTGDWVRIDADRGLVEVTPAAAVGASPASDVEATPAAVGPWTPASADGPRPREEGS